MVQRYRMSRILILTTQPVLIALLLLAIPVLRAGVPQLDNVMDHDPELPIATIEYHLPERWQTLWTEALAGPEEDLRREVAAALLRAHQLGCPELESFGDKLQQALDESQHPTVRLTIAAALIELDDRSSAQPLFEVLQTGGLRESLLIEPALARWDFTPIRDIWLARLSVPPQVPRQQLLLAIEGLRTVNESRAVESLHPIVLDQRENEGVRLAAATALGELRPQGLLDVARRLTDDQSLVNRLIAVRLLAGHQDAETRNLLLTLAVDDQSAVAAAAIRELLEIDEELVHPLVPELLTSSDATVRQLAATSLVERPSVAIIETLGGLLDDPHPDVRTFVQESLRQLAEQEQFDAVIRSTASEVLSNGSWCGLEQSARLLGELDHKAASERLLELLSHERPEVFVSAAWALCQLQVPDTLSGMQRFAESMTAGFNIDPATTRAGQPNLTAGQDACLSHLFQAFGVMKFADCEQMLLKFVPRRYDLGPKSRAAAIWTLGLLHEGDAQEELMMQFGMRLNDEGTFPMPEPIEVRANAALGLGRMNAPPLALEILRKFYDGYEPGNRIREACGWSIERLTGEDLPPPPPHFLLPPSQFLRPLD